MNVKNKKIMKVKTDDGRTISVLGEKVVEEFL